MKKIFKLIAIAIATVACFGAATGCDKSTDYPDYKNPEVAENNSGTKYAITVQSKGGIKLNDVRVIAKKNGAKQAESISVNGLVEFDLPLDEYELEFADLPKGYYVDPSATYKTSATERKSTVSLPSQVINQTAPAEVSYNAGDVMYDFAFTDCFQNKYTLSQTLNSANKKAVIINFWYESCNPCRAEFPCIQEAYEEFSDKLEIFALSNQDSNSSIQKFVRENGYSFPMGSDTEGLVGIFKVTSFPTTLVIDRYGVIAYWSMGTEPSTAFWRSLMNNFTSDSYVQEVETVEGGGTGNTPTEMEKPDIPFPSSRELENAANAEGYTASYKPENDEYSWPWLAGKDDDGKTYIYPANSGKDNSYAIVLSEVKMKKDQVLSFDYYISSELNSDILYCLVDGKILGTYSGNGGDWKTKHIYVSDREKTVELAFIYQKDEQLASYNDTARICNIRLSAVSEIKDAIDVVREAAYGGKEGKGYAFYKEVIFNPEDNFYHIKNPDGSIGPLLLVNLETNSPWTEVHCSSNYGTADDGAQYYNSLYYLTYWMYHVGDGEFVTFPLNGNDHTRTVLNYWRASILADDPNHLLPVSEDIKQWAIDFAENYKKDTKGDVTNENTWLEFCYYYDHYGAENDPAHVCRKEYDPIDAMLTINCRTAYLKGSEELKNKSLYPNGRNIANVDKGINAFRGMYYKFTAPKAGVYYIRSFVDDYSSVSAEPAFFIKNADDEYIQEEIYTSREIESMITDGKGHRTNDLSRNFGHYIYLDGNETVYFLMCMHSPGATGYYEFEIEYKGESYEKMLVCTTADGLWTYDEITNITYYLAIDVIPEDGLYYANKNGAPGSKIYIDFVHANYMDNGNKSLYDMIQNGQFNLTKYGLGNYQNAMNTYYKKSIAGKSVNDELYGMIEADAELIEILNKLIDVHQQGRESGNGWLQFACYYETFSE